MCSENNNDDDDDDAALRKPCCLYDLLDFSNSSLFSLEAVLSFREVTGRVSMGCQICTGPVGLLSAGIKYFLRETNVINRQEELWVAYRHCLQNLMSGPNAFLFLMVSTTAWSSTLAKGKISSCRPDHTKRPGASHETTGLFAWSEKKVRTILSIVYALLGLFAWLFCNSVPSVFFFLNPSAGYPCTFFAVQDCPTKAVWCSAIMSFELRSCLEKEEALCVQYTQCLFFSFLAWRLKRRQFRRRPAMSSVDQ